MLELKVAKKVIVSAKNGVFVVIGASEYPQFSSYSWWHMQWFLPRDSLRYGPAKRFAWSLGRHDGQN